MARLETSVDINLGEIVTALTLGIEKAVEKVKSLPEDLKIHIVKIPREDASAKALGKSAIDAVKTFTGTLKDIHQAKKMRKICLKINNH